MNTKTAEEILGQSCYPHECGSMIEIVTKQDALRAINEYASPLKKRVEELEDALRQCRMILSDMSYKETVKKLDNILNPPPPMENNLNIYDLPVYSPVVYLGLSEQNIEYGKYLVVRKDGKTHLETFNGTGWAYNGNSIVAYYLPKIN